MLERQMPSPALPYPLVFTCRREVSVTHATLRTTALLQHRVLLPGLPSPNLVKISPFSQLPPEEGAPPGPVGCITLPAQGWAHGNLNKYLSQTLEAP